MQQTPHTKPTVAAGAVILDEQGRVLLIRRAQEPGAGRWTIPGGKLRMGERLRDCVQREALEETGLVVSVGSMIEIAERVTRGSDGGVRYHYVIIDFICHVLSGTARAGSDADRVVWVNESELSALDVIDGTMAVIAKARQVQREGVHSE